MAVPARVWLIAESLARGEARLRARPERSLLLHGITTSNSPIGLVPQAGPLNLIASNVLFSDHGAAEVERLGQVLRGASCTTLIAAAFHDAGDLAAAMTAKAATLGLPTTRVQVRGGLFRDLAEPDTWWDDTLVAATRNHSYVPAWASRSTRQPPWPGCRTCRACCETPSTSTPNASTTGTPMPEPWEPGRLPCGAAPSAATNGCETQPTSRCCTSRSSGQPCATRC